MSETEVYSHTALSLFLLTNEMTLEQLFDEWSCRLREGNQKAMEELRNNIRKTEPITYSIEAASPQPVR